MPEGVTYVSKSSISEKFTVLRKYGFTVICFQTDHIKRTQEKGMTDLLIIDPRGYVIFVEIKTDNDKIRESQKPLLEIISGLKDVHNIIYAIAESHNYIELRDNILSRNYHKIKPVDTIALYKPKQRGRPAKKKKSTRK
jgi:hypothetical protein